MFHIILSSPHVSNVLGTVKADNWIIGCSIQYWKYVSDPDDIVFSIANAKVVSYQQIV